MVEQEGGVAAAIFIVAFVLVSFSLDWFDPREVVQRPSSLLLLSCGERQRTRPTG
jgi:hypothetical protein